jgi:hypothetical protein
MFPPCPYFSAVVWMTSERRPVMYTFAPLATSAWVICRGMSTVFKPNDKVEMYHKTNAGSSTRYDGLKTAEGEEVGSSEDGVCSAHSVCVCRES